MNHTENVLRGHLPPQKAIKRFHADWEQMTARGTRRTTAITVSYLMASFVVVFSAVAVDRLVWLLAIIAGAASIMVAVRYLQLSVWSFPLIVSLAWVSTDVFGLSNSGGFVRYLPALLIAIVLVSTRREPVRLDLTRAAAMLLFLYGLIGSIYGRLENDSTNGVLPLVIPMIVMLVARNRMEIRNLRIARLSRSVAVLCAIFSLMVYAARANLLPLPLSVYNHEKSYLVVLGIGCAIVARSKILFLANIVTGISAFLVYPAATYMVSIVIAAATALVFSSVILSRIRYGFSIGIIISVALAQVYLADFLAAASGYFELVGKSDNGSTRERLYRAAAERIQEPFFNQGFTRDVTFKVNLSGELTEVPAHNDFLTLAVGGGYVAQGLLVLVFIGLNLSSLRAYWSSHSATVRRFILALLATCNAAFVSAFANPVFMNPGSSTVIFAAACTLLMINSRQITPSSPHEAQKPGPAELGIPVPSRYGGNND